MEKKIKIQSEHGLHARPAGVFVKKASEFKSTVSVQAPKGTVNGKSLMSLMSLGLNKGDEINLIVTGEDEVQALQALETLLTPSESAH